jgi:hypothetical protein
VYGLFKVEQKATNLMKCKQIKHNRGIKNVDIEQEAFLEQPSWGTLIIKRLETKIM